MFGKITYCLQSVANKSYKEEKYKITKKSENQDRKAFHDIEGVSSLPFI